ncbi:phosphotransferase family protein [Labedaea rhizosphaerae]|uniref:phosphotransferase family protein n=1 Tax=Labedaea rhizosphaerae TaxID=598644 RepID=UPI001414ED6F|nr:aminoglycoside phosphotransferase family protein [Labedaea rhizosphaerae]
MSSSAGDGSGGHRSLDPGGVHRWAGELAGRGYRPAPLAAGVEGAVFRLGNGAVAKVWNSRTEAEIARLATFLDAVGGAGLPFRTPEILDVGHLSDAVFSIERELSGVPLFPDHTGQSPPLEPERLRCITDVLAALAAVTPRDELKVLPVLDEPDPLWGAGDFTTALGRLVLDRVERSCEHMRAAVPDVGELARALADRLSAMDAGPDGLIHGDLIPANILVDDGGRVTALLDFGFFSTVGPPAFDAAVAMAIFDMYGPARLASRVAMEELVRGTFGYPWETLAVYLAAYAVVTMTLFGSSEQEGHFHWCAEVLRRPDVMAAL